MGLTQNRPAADARHRRQKPVHLKRSMLQARLTQQLQAGRMRVLKFLKGKVSAVKDEGDDFATQLKQFQADFSAYGSLHQELLAQKSLLRANLSKLGVVLAICKDLHTEFASQGVEIQFSLSARPLAEGGGILLLVQPLDAELSIYTKLSGIAKKHARDLVALKPRLSIQADYSKAAALVSA